MNAVAAGDVGYDLLGTELVEHARERATKRLGGIAERVAVAMAVAFLAAATCMAVFLPAVRPFSVTTAVLAVLTYALASRVQFEVRNNFAAPTQLVLVPMLLALPPRDVPLLIAAGYVAGQLRRPTHPRSHTPIDIANAWYSIGPAVVLAFWGHTTPGWQHAGVYVAAFGGQIAVDFATTATWSRIAYRVPVLDHVSSMRETALFDAALSPIGIAVAISTVGRPWGILLVLPMVGLLYVFAQERQRRLDNTVELSHAYRGTALLLGEMIEADDEYTGSHSRDVVELAIAVAERLDLTPLERRQAEFAALLHDVGKVKIPPEIINKPGPLDDDERALMNTHTLIGEEMLGQVGGLLGNIGHVVRSCHERWDGAGYPDGLAGEDIPIAARIVCACDAWSAMTTDRSYRARLTDEEATLELRACSGTHFDPRIVDALLAVLSV
ncbi:MAG: HD-GYP domain-containing protein [Actinobacteria bacterium]|nr:HD-GYP domain-containing protein [Actinomycetota bacterium]